ncbi:MAG TPA: YbaB/EbfC family nucleoid-associated protein [Deinococcales bacterium]|nr:YbaB/EbfC family nucleoid-associated protein [Deinococcales bacterium]
MDMKKLMKQMQKAQAAQADVQDRLAAASVTGSAGSGLVTVTANGQGNVTGVKLKAEAVDPEDVEALEDLILVAIEDAQRKAADLQQSEMQKIVSSFGGGF